MKIQKPKGTQDLYENKIKEYKRIEEFLQQVSYSYNYSLIETPIFENAELFLGIGEESDIVSKEMYVFNDKSDRKLALRPEGTAAVARSVSENKMITNQASLPLRLFYYGDMFRYERPQKGRFRQFKQYGVELYSEKSPYFDFEIILMADRIIKQAGIKNYVFLINSIGSTETRNKYITEIKKILTSKISELSDDSKRRLNTNPLRILDSKDENDIKLVSTLPTLREFLTAEEENYFTKIVELMESNSIKYEIDSKLVRGLDYYNDFVFEVVETNNDSRTNTILGGGRYESIIENVKDVNMSSVGFAIGIERLINKIKEDNPSFFKDDENFDLYIGSLSEQALIDAISLGEKLHNKNINIYIDYDYSRKIKYHFSKVDKLSAKHMLIIGDSDLENNSVSIKNTSTKESNVMSIDDVLEFFN